MFLSIVSPVRNEAENLLELHQRLTKVAESFGKDYEIIYTENGSTDDSLKILRTLKGAKVLSLRIPIPSNKSSQSSALDAGIKASKGELIVTIDSDLQNPPEEIPKMIRYLRDNNLDVVSGWRQKRMDTSFIKYLSMFGSWLRRKFINPGVHDLGCTLKVYKRECFESLDIHGEMHRYIVAILKWRGFLIGEVVVTHQERVGGNSNYNWTKMFRGFVDMWLIWFTRKYSDRPLHFFGVSGVFIALGGFGLLFILFILRLFELIVLSTSIFPLVAVLMIILGVQLFAFGMMMDSLMKSYHSQNGINSYLIKEQFQNSK